MMTRTLEWILVGIGAFLLAVALIWFLFFRPTASLQSTSQQSSFGTASNVSTATTNATNAGANGSQPVAATGQISQNKIFELTVGPVVGATLYQTLNPTTTLARYINQDDGHVYDLPLDVPGALPRVVSNTTIPGGQRVLWTAGNNAIMQYLENSTIKTLYLGFPSQSGGTTTQATTHLQFFPDAIEDIAVSPDGKSSVYLLSTASGVDGYVSQSSGLNSKKLFSLSLSQVLVSWPSQGTILAETKSAAGVPGIVFSINASTGAATPLLYGQGITATADPKFSLVLYQASDGSTLTSYFHSIQSGANVPVATINPLPEQCIWGKLNITNVFCAAPIQAAPAYYFDQWHAGTASAGEDIFKLSTVVNGLTQVIAPGSSDGGNPTDILEMALSSDEHYLDFVSKGDRSLWAVRLTQ